MNESLKTTQFLIAAGVSVVLAAFTSWSSAPSKLGGYDKVGQEFFDDLADPSVATALRVVTYNETTASARPFTVERKDGVWRIPSHHNYPADGKDRLAKLASSLIGTKRAAVASLVVADHERYGVIDPLDEKAESLKGRGQRITLLKDGDVTIADMIIGNKVEGQTDAYYVRRADEVQTYKASLKIDISTKFADWVEADLLKLERDNIVRLDSIHSKISPQNEVQESTERLTRDKVADPWKLEGLNEETEEVNKGDIDAMVTVLDNLKLVGVRERPKLSGQSLLGNDLSVRLPKGAARNPQVVQAIVRQLRDSLQEKGFMVLHDEKADEARMYSVAGELIAAMNDGIRYHLNFGNVFAGSEEEIEIGASEKDGEKKEQKAEDDKDEKKDGSKKSRYLFVRASFDDSLLGGKPVEPTKPEVPAGVNVDENGEVIEAKEAKQDDEKKPEEKKDGDKKDDDASKADDKKEEPKKDPAAEYKAALASFKKAMDRHAADLKAFEKKTEDGAKKVKDLNDRFADWYYVISAEDFDKLRLSRDQMVKAKEKKPDAEKPEAEAKPENAKPADAAKTDTPVEKPAAKPEPKDGDKPADPKPETKEGDKKPDEKKTDEAKPEAGKTEAAKPEEKKPAAEAEKPKADGDAK